MRLSKVVRVLIFIAPLGLARPARAHHSFAMYDNQKTLTLEGTVKEFLWTNPHCHIQLLVKDPQTNREVEWTIEGASPQGQTRQGWTRDSAKPGDKAVITIHPLKDGSAGGELLLMSINGKKIGHRP